MAPKLSIRVLTLGCAMTLNAVSLAGQTGSPHHGLSRAALVSQLGAPQSTLSFRDTTICHYPGQSFTLLDGRVVSSQPNQLQSIDKVRPRIAAKKSEAAARKRERYRDSGELSHLGPQALREFWLRFQNRHPELDLGPELAAAQLAVERQERLRLQAEVDELKQTVADLRSRSHRRYDYPSGHYLPGRHLGFHSRDFHKTHRRRNQERRDPTPVDRAALIPKTKPLPNDTHRFAIPRARPVEPIVR